MRPAGLAYQYLHTSVPDIHAAQVHYIRRPVFPYEPYIAVGMEKRTETRYFYFLVRICFGSNTLHLSLVRIGQPYFVLHDITVARHRILVSFRYRTRLGQAVHQSQGPHFSLVLPHQEIFVTVPDPPADSCRQAFRRLFRISPDSVRTIAAAVIRQIEAVPVPDRIQDQIMACGIHIIKTVRRPVLVPVTVPA